MTDNDALCTCGHQAWEHLGVPLGACYHADQMTKLMNIQQWCDCKAFVLDIDAKPDIEAVEAAVDAADLED